MNQPPDASAFDAAPDDTDQAHPDSGHGDQQTENQPADRVTANTKLVRMAESGYRFGISDTGEPFASLVDGAQHLAFPLRGGRLGLREQLAYDYYRAEGKAASQSALSDALAVLTGKARGESETELHIRTAKHGDSIWIDRNTAAGDVIEVTPERINLRQSAPVMFKRTQVGKELPVPEQGGNVLELFTFLNVQPIDQAPLLAALVAAFIPEIQHPIVTFTGEQGTGKTTAAKLLVSLTDPSAAPTRKPPRDGEALVNTMQSSWVVAFDNLSTVPLWLSDALCRAVTGEADVRRQMYTDSDSVVFRFMKPMMLTGIDFAGLRGDLAERLLMVELHRIEDTRRRSETALQQEWEAARPRLFGSLLELTAQVLRILPELQLRELGRLADYGRILAAVDKVLGTDGLTRYRSQSAELAADSLSSSPVSERLLAIQPDFFGTSAQLLTELAPADPDERLPKGWPANGRAVTSALTRDAPSLRKNGWRVDDRGLNRDGTKVWHILAPDRHCSHGV